MPNPTQFNFAPGTVISSAQVNSNFYGIETQIFALIGGLNGCAWIPGATIGAVTATPPIAAALGTCTSNTGAGVTLTLSLSGALPANVPAGGVTYVPPYYNSGGGSFASTLHGVIGTVTAAANTSTSVGFTGVAAFTSTTSYSCSFSSTTANSSIAIFPSNISASQANFTNTTATVTPGVYHCVGY